MAQSWSDIAQNTEVALKLLLKQDTVVSKFLRNNRTGLSFQEGFESQLSC